jgi:hypothetical protein
MSSTLRNVWLAAVLLSACRGESRAPQRIEQIIAAVPDSAMRARWRAASDSGRLPALSRLHLPDSARLVRRPSTLTSAVRQASQPRITPGAVAEVKVTTTPRVRTYRGAVTLRAVAAGRLSGQLEGGNIVELLYKLPDTVALTALQPGAYQLRLRDEVVEESQRREVVLRRGNGSPVLWYISDGSATAYRRRFEELPLTIEQVAPDSGRQAAVRVALGTSQALLRVGQRGTLRDGEGPVQVVVLSSFWTTPGRAPRLVEGDPYHVVVIGYRQ